MLDKVRSFYGASAPTSLATLDTVEAGQSAVVTHVEVTNNADSQQAFTIYFNGVIWAPAIKIAAKSQVLYEIARPLAAGQTIAGFATSTEVKLFISGVQG